MQRWAHFYGHGNKEGKCVMGNVLWVCTLAGGEILGGGAEDGQVPKQMPSAKALEVVNYLHGPRMEMIMCPVKRGVSLKY